MADVAVRGAELFSVKLPKASHHNFTLLKKGLIYPDHATRYLNSQPPATRSVLRTFTKSGNAAINAAST
jgi:hypothetical protein